jgi:hypothetical protein
MKKVKFRIINHQKSNPNPIKYKNWSSFRFLMAKNRILIQPNIKKVKFGIINHQKTNPNPIKYKKWSSFRF